MTIRVGSAVRVKGRNAKRTAFVLGSCDTLEVLAQLGDVGLVERVDEVSTHRDGDVKLYIVRILRTGALCTFRSQNLREVA